ncbi:hypothetical protein [Planctomicrobium sp. SH664]|uniref:hypothetical protein n=1 Tax=Planctomicrobium sp. SH664 TaxID=3448125 RepID=UPI003F5C8045
MNDPFEFILAGKSFQEVLQALARSHPERLEKTGRELSQPQIVQVDQFARSSFESTSVHRTLVYGAMFYLLSFIVDSDYVKVRFDVLLQEFKTSRTQAYRCRAVWCCFGELLLREPDLQRFFCAEALKILAESEIPQSARNEALQLARERVRVSINTAVTLKYQRGTSVVPVKTDTEQHVAQEGSEPFTPVTSRQRSTRRAKKWLFVGAAARIEVIPTHAAEIEDVEALIHDLEAAIAELRNKSST